MKCLHPTSTNPDPGQEGFSILEVLISMAVLCIGLLAILGLFTSGLAAVQTTQEDLLARQKAQEALESIYTARNTQQVTFDQIQNVANGGIFANGYTPLNLAGPDGLLGTADDGPVETMITPGQDALLGTADDVITPLSNYRRQIAITPVLRPDNTANPDLRQITVSIEYTAPKMSPRTYTVACYVSRYR
jgi:prepilin-type N-terminal cleavage/methylation domain-containing protein